MHRWGDRRICSRRTPDLWDRYDLENRNRENRMKRHERATQVLHILPSRAVNSTADRLFKSTVIAYSY